MFVNNIFGVLSFLSERHLQNVKIQIIKGKLEPHYFDFLGYLGLGFNFELYASFRVWRSEGDPTWPAVA